MKEFASLCVLGYKRPNMLQSCLDSLLKTVDYPCEIIVNMDAANADFESQMIAEGYLHSGKISKLITVAGKNRGVGRSLQNCLGVSEGRYVFKIDTDLTFSPHWLSTSINILNTNPDIGAVSLFDYRHYDPKDERFNHVKELPDCFIVDDFVSSIFGFRIEDLKDPLAGVYGMIPDDGLHQSFGQMAITKTDFVKNSGFGDLSTYVTKQKDGSYEKTPTYSESLLFSDK